MSLRLKSLDSRGFFGLYFLGIIQEHYHEFITNTIYLYFLYFIFLRWIAFWNMASHSFLLLFNQIESSFLFLILNFQEPNIALETFW